jgi:hypothetical protein
VINYIPNHHHSLTPRPLPSPRISPYRHFQQHTRNRAPAARFRLFGPKHPLPTCVVRRPPQPPQWPHPPATTSSPYRTIPPFPPAHPKPSPGRSNSVFRPQTAPPRLRCQMATQTTATGSPPSPYELPLPPPTAISNGKPETKPHRSVLRRGPNRPPPLRARSANHHHHLHSAIPHPKGSYHIDVKPPLHIVCKTEPHRSILRRGPSQNEPSHLFFGVFFFHITYRTVLGFLDSVTTSQFNLTCM